MNDSKTEYIHFGRRVIVPVFQLDIAQVNGVNPSDTWGLTLAIYYQLNLKMSTANNCTKINANFMAIRNFPPKTFVARQH